MNSKGYFTTIVVVLLIILLLGTISSRIVEKINTNKTNNELIQIKDLTYSRTEFEYNVKNAIKIQLDNEIQETQEQPILKSDTDILLGKILLDYNISLIFISGLLVQIFDCGDLVCAYYKYSILYDIKKDFSKNKKTIEYKIPIDYFIENARVVIS